MRVSSGGQPLASSQSVSLSVRPPASPRLSVRPSRAALAAIPVSTAASESGSVAEPVAVPQHGPLSIVAFEPFSSPPDGSVQCCVSSCARQGVPAKRRAAAPAHRNARIA